MKHIVKIHVSKLKIIWNEELWNTLFCHGSASTVHLTNNMDVRVLDHVGTQTGVDIINLVRHYTNQLILYVFS